MKRFSLVIIGFALLSVWAISCKKNNSPAPVYDISYTGNLWVDDTISFQSTAPASSKFYWQFGDGTTSTLANPKHVYSKLGNSGIEFDTVVLIINEDTARLIKKVIEILPGINRAIGVRNWKRILYQLDSTISLPDTTFGCSMYENSVSIFGDTLFLEAANNTLDFAVYQHKYVIVYFWKQDSLVFGDPVNHIDYLSP